MHATRLALMAPLFASLCVSSFGQKWSRGSDGRVTVTPVSVDKKYRNQDWPADWEQEFWDRANLVLRETASGGSYGNTFFENEKRAYGWAMLSLLGGFEEPALKFLQEEDNMGERWNKHTLGIDYYPCFTLKHQMRKYFFFGRLLDKDYKKRMYDAAKIFTEKDPLRRPHYAYTGTGAWGPDGKNSWVDVRSTDNLKLMRDTSVYLLAEETGNEATRKIYKQNIQDFVVTMYHQGMGEWDSENYLGHSIAPVINLYDFAQDPEVKLLAKAALDWMTAAAAVKYYRGNYNGPTRRDYNHPYPFGGSAAALTWLWFGDSPIAPHEFESDEIHVITSAYRPPAAVVHLARKNFERPAEIVAGKPDWAAWQNLDTAAPTFRETHYFGKNFLFGTLARGSQRPDINGFKIVTYSKSRGADTIIAGPVSDPLKLGSVQYNDSLIAANSAVGQNGNVAIYLTAQSDHPYLWLAPKDAKVEKSRNTTFIRTEKTTIAIWPINLTDPREDRELTETIQFKEKKTKEGVVKEPGWADSKILKSQRRRDGVYGFAIEIDEGDANSFIKQAAAIGPETDEVAVRGAAAITGVSGRRVRLQWGDTLAAIKIWRDGKRRAWESDDENAAYRTLGDRPLIHQSWQGDGALNVSAGGKTFRCTVTKDGKVSFSE
jgi:hypothetical protein